MIIVICYYSTSVNLWYNISGPIIRPVSLQVARRLRHRRAFLRQFGNWYSKTLDNLHIIVYYLGKVERRSTKKNKETKMNASETTKIVTSIIENGRAANNDELRSEFEFEASEKGFSDDEIQEALSSEWFPWMKN